jgi:hypothetical protein
MMRCVYPTEQGREPPKKLIEKDKYFLKSAIMRRGMDVCYSS